MFDLIILEEVEQYIHHLSRQEQNKVIAYFRNLEVQGYNLRRPIADNLGHGWG